MNKIKMSLLYTMKKWFCTWQYSRDMFAELVTFIFYEKVRKDMFFNVLNYNLKPYSISVTLEKQKSPLSAQDHRTASYSLLNRPILNMGFINIGSLKIR